MLVVAGTGAVWAYCSAVVWLGRRKELQSFAGGEREVCVGILGRAVSSERQKINANLPGILQRLLRLLSLEAFLVLEIE